MSARLPVTNVTGEQRFWPILADTCGVPVALTAGPGGLAASAHAVAATSWATISAGAIVLRQKRRNRAAAEVVSRLGSKMRKRSPRRCNARPSDGQLAMTQR